MLIPDAARPYRGYGQDEGNTAFPFTTPGGLTLSSGLRLIDFSGDLTSSLHPLHQ